MFSAVRFVTFLAASVALTANSRAQTAATWIGPSGDEWNTPADWDVGAPPGDLTTNANIGAGSLVNYSLPMAAASFGGLTLGGTLNVNTNKFNIDMAGGATAPVTINGGGVLNVNAGGVLTLTNSGILTLAIGGALNVTNGVLTMTNSVGTAGINVGPNGRNNGATVALSNATVTLDRVLAIQGGASSGNLASLMTVSGGTLNCLGGSRILNSTDDSSTRLVVDNGAVANLGAFIVQRTGPNGGLIVSNGVANATGVQVGTGNSRAFAAIYGGVLTNTGVFTISDTTNAAATGDRRSQFLLRGGAVVSTSPDGIVIANQSNNGGTVNNANIGGVLDISAGTLTAEKITLIKDTTLTNAYARLQFSGTGIIYLGSGGLVANVGAANTAFNIVPSGGTLAAKADWSSAAPMAMSGTVTFLAADALGVAHNITLAGVLSGSGALTKSGAGVLTLNTNDTYSGNTAINAGAFALGATGSISNSPQIAIASGAVYDVSAVGGVGLVGSQILSGQGAVIGNLTAPAGSAIRPAGNALAGTLTFSNSLTESGGVINGFDLSDDPSGTVKTNDFISIAGDLNLSGTNTIQVSALNGPLVGGSTYKLIHYGGNLVGDITNLALSGAAGSLTNNPVTKTVSLTVASGVRSAANVTWLGDGGANNWDLLATSNWLNGVSRDYFVSGDNARFDSLGATNPLVNVVGSVLPGSIIVDAPSNYTFAGSGSIDGTGGLVKTNSATLTILTTNNNYPGDTTIGGGVLEAIRLANGGTPSSIGLSSSDPTNLLFYGTTLRYLGPTASTDRGATLNASGATLDVATNGSVLTWSGVLVGSGGLTKAGPGTLTLPNANSYTGTTTISNGTLRLNDAGAAGANVITLAGGGLQFGTGFTLNDTLNIVGTGSTIIATTTSPGNPVLGRPVTGNGTVTINNTVIFTVNADMQGFSGTVSLGTSSNSFRFNSGGNSSGAQQSVGSSNAVFDLGTGAAALVNRNGGNTTYYLGALAGGPNTQVRGSENSGSPSIYQIGDRNLNATFAGSIRNGLAGGSTPQASAAVTLLKVGTGTLTLTGTNTYSGSTTVSNGVLALSDGGMIGASPTLNVVSNTVLDASGRTDGAITLNTDQTLLGEGTVRGSVIAAAGSTVAPGAASGFIGKLLITNALTFQSGSTNAMDLDTVNATNDVISGLASITFGGTLAVGGDYFSVTNGSSFRLFNAAFYQGAFDSIVPALPVPGLMWDTSSLAANGILKVTLQRPTIGSSGTDGSTFVFRGTLGTPFGTYFVLSSTNLTDWTPVLTNLFEADGSFAYTNAITPGVPKQFFRLQTP